MSAELKGCRICALRPGDRGRVVEEGGVTDASLHNVHVLIERRGAPVRVTLRIDGSEGHLVELAWKEGVHVCSGFSGVIAKWPQGAEGWTKFWGTATPILWKGQDYAKAVQP